MCAKEYLFEHMRGVDTNVEMFNMYFGVRHLVLFLLCDRFDSNGNGVDCLVRKAGTRPVVLIATGSFPVTLCRLQESL